MLSHSVSTRSRTWLFGASVYLLLAANFLLHRNLDFEDSWITFRYARNLAESRGLVFNPTDARPTEGFTSIFHVLFSALGIRAGLDPLLFSEITGLLLLCILPFLALWSLRRHWKDAPFSCVIPLALYLPAAATAWQVCSGMETIFFAVGVFLLADLAAGTGLSGSPMRGAVLGLAGTVLVLIRPEGGILFAGHLCLLALRARRAGLRRSAGILAAAGGTFSLGLAAYLAWKWSYFGTLLPNSYYVKTYGGVFGLPPEVWPGLKHVVQFLVSFDYGFPQAVLLLLLLLLLRDRVPLPHPAAALLAHQLAPTAVLLLYYTRIVHESCQFRLEFSVLLPLLYSASVLMACPAEAPPQATGSIPSPVFKVAVTLVTGFALLGAAPWNFLHLPEVRWRPGPPPPGATLPQIAEDLKRTGLGRDLVVMTGAVGVIPYVSDVTTLDFVGLTDDVFSGRVPTSVAAVEAYYRSRNPDLIAAKWAPAMASRREDDPAFQGLLRSLRGKYSEGLMVRLYRSEKFLDFVYYVMQDLRDRYEVAAVYAGGPYVLYLRRDSPVAESVRRALEASPYVMRGIDPAAYLAMKSAAAEMDPY